MKQLLASILFLSCVCCLSCGGTGNSPEKDTAGPEKPVVTANHTPVPNSNFYIILPPGFKLNTMSQQLEKEYPGGFGAGFLPFDLVEGSKITIEEYISIAKNETEKKSSGLWESENVQVSGAPAILCRYQPGGPGSSMFYHLYFTGKWKDRSLMAVYDEKDTATGEAMKEALKTVVVE